MGRDTSARRTVLGDRVKRHKLRHAEKCRRMRDGRWACVRECEWAAAKLRRRRAYEDREARAER